jgi:uncharacterized SAM-binding protein YcdF (DUF218 family)
VTPIIVSIPFFVLFAISFAIERRRLVNGVLLLVGLLLLSCATVFELDELPGGHDYINDDVMGMLFMLVMMLLPTFLICNGLLMIRREGRRLGNLLSLLVGIAELAFPLMGFTIIKTQVPALVGPAAFLAGVAVYLSLAFSCFFLYSLVYGHTPYPRGCDYVVVLGSGLIGSQVPPLLASRLNRARKVFDKENERGGNPRIIVSGGQGADEDVSEARAMADYLIGAGVPEDRVILEDKSRNTRQNLLYSKELMNGGRSVVVTNNFHVMRAALLARRVGLDAQVVGARTALYFVPSATIREFVGVLRDYRVINAVCCVCVATLSLTLTITHTH